VAIGEVEPGVNRLWSAPNLTSADSGLGRWSVDDLKKYLKTGFCRRAGVLGPMNEVVGNSLRYLTDADVAAMAEYIKNLPANAESELQRPGASELAAGQALYDKHCDECHLSSGRGAFRKAPPLAGSAMVQSGNAASLVNVILYGAVPAPKLPASYDAWEEMPGFKDKMSDAELATLVNFLRSHWDNRGGRVRPAFVAGQR
jgi:mono/diheme cytochrome c family protein